MGKYKLLIFPPILPNPRPTPSYYPFSQLYTFVMTTTGRMRVKGIRYLPRIFGNSKPYKCTFGTHFNVSFHRIITTPTCEIVEYCIAYLGLMQ
jgi:hypothetical protein